MSFRAATFGRLVTIGFLIAVPCARNTHSQPASIAFTNVTVIDGTGVPPRPAMTVVVTGDRVVAVAAAGRLRVPDDAVLVDGTDKF